MNSDDIQKVLGQTRHKNLYFKGQIPPSWEFKSYHIDLQEHVSSVIAPLGISYTINNLGYNSTFDYTEQLKQQYNILCLGDSNTFGLLLKKELTWVSRLQNKLSNTNVLNLGLPGAGADTVVRIATNAIQELAGRVQAVFVVWPPYLRREFASREFQRMVYKTPNNDEIVPYYDYWKFIDWKSNSYNFHKNKLMIESICRANGIIYSDLEINYEDSLIKQDMIESYGKEEYTTFGFATHRAITDYFVNFLY